MPSTGAWPIAACSYTYSWGVSPAAATFTCPGSVQVGTDDQVAVNLGATVFYGVVKSVLEDRSAGLRTQIVAADNREWLHRESVYCTFNNVETIEDDVTTPGIDRKQRYWAILPVDWETQKKTYTDEPMTVKEILDVLAAAPTVSFGWDFRTHPAQSEAVLGVDANNGAKLASVLQTLSEKQGLVFTIVGYNSIHWVRKGDDTAPNPTAICFDIKTGQALANNDTRVRIVGERNRVQCDSVQLDPDWMPFWQKYWFEPAWIAQVKAKLGPFDDDLAGEAALFAKAKSVTLREYCKVVSGDATQAADHGKWGEVSRMEMPVWVYLNDVVYKAYRVPRTFKIGKCDWSSLELGEGLLAEMDYDPGSGHLSYATGDLAEEYPDTKAFVIAQGQQTDVIDPKYQKALSPDQMAKAATLWSPVHDFSFDRKNKTLIFKQAVILPGADPHGLFVFPNKGFLKKTDACYALALPNAAVSIGPAKVRASLVFEVERYFRDQGSGNREGAVYLNGLAQHSLYIAGVFSREVTFADNKTADEKAEKAASGLVLRQIAYDHGGFKRRGTVGMALNGCIDRVTVNINPQVGIEEEIEYSKERVPRDFLNERELDRRHRTKELFPGRDANRDEVFELNTIAKVGKELSRSPARPIKSLNDVMVAVLGDPQASVSVEKMPTKSGVTQKAKGGQPVARDPATGVLSATGTDFGGVVVADGAGDRAPVAHRGLVPLRVLGPVTSGDPVGMKKTDTGYADYAVSNGLPHIGQARADITGDSQPIVIPVLLHAPRPVSVPFGVSISSTEKDSEGVVTTVKVVVEKQSFVMKSEKWDDKLGVDGLDDEKEIQADEKVWIECPLDADTMEFTNLSVKVGKTGDTNWKAFPDPLEYTTDDLTDKTRKQKKWYQLLAYATAKPKIGEEPREGIALPFKTGAQTLVQCTTTHLIACEKCFTPSGLLVRLLAPWQAPYVKVEG